MDIARPDFKARKTSRRRLMIGLAILVLLSAGVVALTRLAKRPRHQYVTLTHDSRTIQALVISPRHIQKTSVVLLVHEVYGLTDWAKDMAEDLANEGFIVIAPDLLSGAGPHGGGFDDFTSESDRVSAIRGLDPDSVLKDLDAAVDCAEKLPEANGKTAVVGFSWGGRKTFEFAAHRKDLSAVFVFYGTDPEDVATITAPVYGFYGGADGTVTAGVSTTADKMKAAGKFYDPVIYTDADHGFMRVAQESSDTNQNNKTARDAAYKRLVTLLKEMSSTR